MVKLIMGLGNPGRRYIRTRHNAGFMVVDLLAREFGTRVLLRRCRSLVGEAPLEGRKIVLAKPQTFMNNSGEAAKALFKHYRLEPGELIVIHDDLDLDVGRVRVRTRGSSGGHHGLESIFHTLGTKEVGRVKVGIGRPPAGYDTIDYVLEGFAPEEEEAVNAALDRAARAVLDLVDGHSLENVANRYNS